MAETIACAEGPSVSCSQSNKIQVKVEGPKVSIESKPHGTGHCLAQVHLSPVRALNPGNKIKKDSLVINNRMLDMCSVVCLL